MWVRRVFVWSICLVAFAGPACAQATAPQDVPPQNADIWNGIRHQPTRAAVLDREQQTGIALSKKQQHQQTQAVEQLDRQLLEQTQNGSR